MEYLILNNLDAAIKDEPKPALFGPTAGKWRPLHIGGRGGIHIGRRPGITGILPDTV